MDDRKKNDRLRRYLVIRSFMWYCAGGTHQRFHVGDIIDIEDDKQMQSMIDNGFIDVVYFPRVRAVVCHVLGNMDS